MKMSTLQFTAPASFTIWPITDLVSIFIEVFYDLINNEYFKYGNNDVLF